MATRKPRAAPRADVPDPFAPQQELAPVDPVPTDAARTAIATINTQLSEMDRVEAGIADLERSYKGVVYPVDTPKGMREACDARATINKPLFATEHARKAAKAPVLALGRDIDARAKVIDTRLRALVDPIADQIKVQEEKEAERRRELQRRIDEIEATPRMCIGKTAAQLQEVIDGLDGLDLESFQERRPDAAAAQFRVTQEVKQLLQNARLAEEAAELRRKQQEAEQRRARLQAEVDALGDCLALPYRTAERVQQAITRLEAVAIGEDFEEFAPAAREKKAAVLAELAALRDRKLAAEKVAEEALATPPFGGSPVAAAMLVSAVEQEARRIVAPSADFPDNAKIGGFDALVNPAARGNAGDTLNTDHVDARDRPFEPRVDAFDKAQFASGRNSFRHNGQREVGMGPEVWTPAPGSIEPPDADIVDAEVRRRPSDTEILALVASHYDVTWTEAARWLRGIDFDTALRQQPLLETK